MTGSYQLAFVNGILWNGFNIVILLLVLRRSRQAERRGEHQAATAATP